MSRPSTFTEDLAEEICARIMESDYGVEQICEAEELPSARTIFRWLAERETFRQQYARAKEAQGHVQADRALKDATTATDAAIGRLKFDARKWAASKLAPKQYGEAVNLKHSDPDGGPVQTSVDLTGLTPEQLRAIASIKLPADA